MADCSTISAVPAIDERRIVLETTSTSRAGPYVPDAKIPTLLAAAILGSDRQDTLLILSLTSRNETEAGRTMCVVFQENLSQPLKGKRAQSYIRK